MAPKPGNVVQRKRLFKLLDKVLCQPVAWISAPAGAGKTTLVASYLAARNIKPLWYQVDFRDADPAAFFAYLRQAVVKLSPRKREPLPLLSPEYSLGLHVFVHNFFEQMFARLPSGTVLVFDNFQDLPESSPLEELLAPVVAALPEGASIVFISRADPPAAFARLRAARQLGYVGPGALILTTEEARQIGKSFVPEGLSAPSLDELNARAGGWTAGLILLLEGAESGAMKQEGEVAEHLFDFFAAEIMRRAPPAIQDFLARSALLPMMDAASTTALTGNSRADMILRDLLRRNYFISRRTGAAVRYEFHPLFRSYLLEELRRRSDPEMLRQLQLRAGRILAECGEDDAAVELLSRAGAVEELVMLVLGRAGQLIAEGRFLTLEQWLQVIPEDVRRAQPWLVYWLGVSWMPFDLVAARGHFELAHEVFAAVGDVAGMCMSWVGVVDTILNLLDSFAELDPWIDALDRLIDDYGQPTPALAASMAPRMYGALAMRRPQHPRLAQWKAAALAAFDAEQDISSKLLGGFYLSAVAIWTDEFAVAEEMLVRLRRVGEANAAIPAARIVRELFESWFNWLSGRHAQALQAAEAGLAIGRQSGVLLWEPLMLIEALVSAITAGDLTRAAAYIEQLRPMLPHARRWDRAYFYHECGWHAALSGELAEALRLQTTAVKLITEMGGAIPEAEVRLGMAQALSLDGRREERDRELEEARRLGELAGSPLIAFSTAFAGAGYALEDGDTERARLLAALALRIGRGQGYRNFTWWLPQQASRLCAFALEQGIETAYVRELIRTRSLTPPRGELQSESWPWPVKIRLLGHFLLEIDGQAANLGGRVQSRVIEMLKVIVALGGREVAEQQISDLLWPEADGDMARQNFKTTLHRLRKLIGQDAVLLSGGRLSLNAHHVWLDTQAYEQQLTALETAADGEVAWLAGRVLEQYRGGFLPQEQQTWLLGLRERLRSRFLRIIGQAAGRLCDLGLWQTAIDCYQKALEIEPLAERFYTGLMRCHHQLGQVAEGLAVHRRCRDVLSAELHISPSTETEQWHERLQQAGSVNGGKETGRNKGA